MPPSDDEDDSEEDGDMDVNADFDTEELGGSMDVDEDPLIPMPQSTGIQALREKLHVKMAAARRGRGHTREAGDKDELLEERRLQRAAMRERRRKETREKKKREEEAKTAKKKGSSKSQEGDQRREFKVQGNLTKVRLRTHLVFLPLTTRFSHNFSFLTIHLIRVNDQTPRPPTSPSQS